MASSGCRGLSTQVGKLLAAYVESPSPAKDEVLVPPNLGTRTHCGGVMETLGSDECD